MSDITVSGYDKPSIELIRCLPIEILKPINLIGTPLWKTPQPISKTTSGVEISPPGALSIWNIGNYGFFFAKDSYLQPENRKDKVCDINSLVLENEELEERIKTLTRELDEKNKIIENLSKGGGGGDDFSKTVLQKVNILEEHNKKLQQLIQQMQSFTLNKETLNTILDKIKELQQHQYKLDQSINELTQFKPFKMNNEPLIEIDHDFKSKTSNLIPLLQSTKKEKNPVLTS
jgi:hypothetical protein